MTDSPDEKRRGLFRRKNKPKKRRWYNQLWDVYTDVRKQQPSITWILLGLIFGGAAAGYGIAQFFGPGWMGAVFGLMLGLIAAMALLGRRAEKFAYARLEGEAGAVGAALSTIRSGWNIEQEPVAVDPRTRDVVFRAVGRPGVVLISEGPPHRAARLLANERKRVQRVIPNVPVVTVQAGREEGQVPLPKVAKAVRKQKAQLSRAQVAEVSQRLRALQQSALPVPKGIDPTRARPDRKAMKGR